MSRALSVLLLALGLTACGPSANAQLAANQPQEIHGTRETRFAPGPECEELLVRSIDRARSEILGMAYGLTSRPVEAALLRAKARGVSVSLVADCKANLRKKSSICPDLEAAGVVVVYDCDHPIMHDKVWVFDRERYTTGSYNPSRNAKRNAENLNLFTDPDGAKEFIDHWRLHAAHAMTRAEALAAQSGAGAEE